MHEAFRDVKTIGHGQHKVLFLHGAGGGIKGIPERLCRELDVTVIAPLAASGKSWWDKREMFELFMDREPLLPVADGIASLVKNEGISAAVGYSQGAVALLEAWAGRPDMRLDTVVASCGTLLGLWEDRDRYLGAGGHPTRIFLSAHRRDPKVPWFMVKQTRKFLKRFDTRFSFDKARSHDFFFDEDAVRARLGSGLISR
ncbi:MAG: hypothetical protein AcusKO_29170 [Acuticoccus sp.]